MIKILSRGNSDFVTLHFRKCENEFAINFIFLRLISKLILFFCDQFRNKFYFFAVYFAMIFTFCGQFRNIFYFLRLISQ